MTITRERILTDARLAGAVRRYHTWPMHTQDTVGHHSWNVCRIYWSIWGPLPPEVSTFIIWHDLGEIRTGDLPFPVKRLNPELKAPLDDLERTTRIGQGGPTLDNMPEWVRNRVKLCDILDMYELGQMELLLGNRYAAPIVVDTEDALARMASLFSDEEWYAVVKYREQG